MLALLGGCYFMIFEEEEEYDYDEEDEEDYPEDEEY